LLGAAAASAGILSWTDPFGDAIAQSTRPAHADELLAQFGSGTTVEKLADGRLAIRGKRTVAGAAVLERMEMAAATEPFALTCSGVPASLTCVPLNEGKGEAALVSGGTVYLRTVHGNITAQDLDSGKAIFDDDEVLCAERSRSTATLSCANVTARTPELEPGEIVSYSPVQIRLEDGRAVSTTVYGPPTVGATRAP
jgi:hypothetical protein